MHAPQHQEDMCVSHSEGHAGLCHHDILHLDYCDPHLAGLSACIIRHLKRIQKAAVWLVTLPKFSCNAMPTHPALATFWMLESESSHWYCLLCCKWLRPIVTIDLRFPFYELSPDAAQQILIVGLWLPLTSG